MNNTNAADAINATAEAVAAAPMPTVTAAAPAKGSWWRTAAKAAGYATLAAVVIGGGVYAYTKYVGGNGGEPSEG